MERKAFQKITESFPADKLLNLIKIELGDMRKSEYKVYENTVFDERLLPKEQTTFGTELELDMDFYTYYREANENGLIDKTMIVRIYNVYDARPDIDDTTILTIETKTGKVQRGAWGLADTEEQVACRLEDINTFVKEVIDEYKRDPNEPKYVVWEYCDPSIRGDYESEYYRFVAYIGYKNKAEAMFEQARRNRAYAGSPCYYYSTPQLLTDNTLTVGFKEVLREAKQLTDEDKFEFMCEECNAEEDERGNY